ncbi:MAG: N-acetylmuramoyl-L-alanine amidase family protein [Eubacterium sp.]|nr:N-acetylmuramoyl-L-alanine amidase family protein [Eubacterium sp.]
MTGCKKKIIAVLLLVAVMMTAVFIPKGYAEAASEPMVYVVNDKLETRVGEPLDISFSFLPGGNGTSYAVTVKLYNDKNKVVKEQEFKLDRSYKSYTVTMNWDTTPAAAGTYKAVATIKYYYVGWNTASSTATTVITLHSASGEWVQNGQSWSYKYNDQVVTGWQQIGKSWFLFDKWGIMLTGWQQADGKWYYFNADGTMATGWKKINGNYYYFGGDGLMRRGWKKISGNYFFFNSAGHMKTGWMRSNGNWYYLKSNGVMATGNLKMGGKTYKFTSSGICQNP